MKILVTGGAGFIGSHIVDKYIEAGHQVLVVDNLSSGNQNQINPKAEFVKMDIASQELATVVSKFAPEVVNHHAAQIDVRASVEDPSFDAQINIVGSLNLLEAVRKTDTVKKVLFASSGGAVYGEAKDIPTTEKEVPAPISPYGVSKLSVEHYLYYYHVVYGLDYIALRYSNVYGPRQNPHGEAGVVAIFYQRILSDQGFVINGAGTQTRDFVYVTDVAHANLLALESNFVGSINIATAIETSVNQLVDYMKKAVDYDKEITHGPGKSGEQQRSCLAYGLAQERLGWQPKVAIDLGLQTTAEFFKNR